MINRMYINYLLLLSTILTFFGMFVACGSQFYRLSVDHDFEPGKRQTTQNNSGSSDGSSSVKFGIHAINGWSKLPVPVKFSKDLSETQRASLFAAMATWEQAVGKKLFAVNGIDTSSGDDFPDLYSSLDDEVNGYYIDRNWEKTGKPEYVLATTIWDNGSSADIIIKADIRFNGKAYIIGDSLKLKSTESQTVVDMQSLALHELGHLLGLTHIDQSIDSTSIMNPALFIGEGLTSRFLSKGDITRIQEIYGCVEPTCDVDALYKTMLNQSTLNSVDPVTGEKFTDNPP